MYDYVDQILQELILRIYMLFRKYRTLPFDELNVFGDVKTLYEQLIEANKAAFMRIALYYYAQEAQRPMSTVSEDDIEEWLIMFLSMPSAVMKYAYDAETVRKRDRLVEAMTATSGSSAEIDKAMRYWTQMAGWFAIDVADEAILRGRKAAGVTLVEWHAEHDNRTCGTCWALDKKIFPLMEVPVKPHPNCRCWTTVVTV